MPARCSESTGLLPQSVGVLHRLFCTLVPPNSPVPPVNHVVKFLSQVCPNRVQVSAPKGLVSPTGGCPGRRGLGSAYRLAFVFLFISRLVCLGGCFSPNTRRKKVQISS